MTAAKHRVTFTLELRPEAQVIDPLRALRKALKILLRAYGLRCIAIEERHHGQKETASDSATSVVRTDAQSCTTPRAADRELGLASEPGRPSRSAREPERRAHISRTRQGLAASRLRAFRNHEICRPNACQSERDGPIARRSSKGQGAFVMSIGKRRGIGSNPLLKFDARNGSFFRVDRNANGEVEQTSIADLKAVFDLANLEVGWIRFDAGTPPSFKMVRVGQDIGNPPTDKHRQGLRLRVRLAGDKGVAREFASTATTLWNAIDRLHDEFERNRGKHSGKLPYVRMAKLEQVKTLLGVVFSPTFEIISWVVRPAELTIAPSEVADPEEEEIPVDLDEATA
jgi:hypothetical protein